MTPTTDPNARWGGYAAAISAALMWGVSGTLAQYLFTQKHVRPEALVEIRLLTTGVLLLVARALKDWRATLAPWREMTTAFELVAFGIFGMLGVQYTFFATIDLSNAATATVLQYLSPVMIVGYLTFTHRRWPSASEAIAIALALVGTALIVTHGEMASLSITPAALAWGLASAVALALYSLLPARLMKRFDSAVIVGWGMLIGGVCVAIATPFDHLAADWDSTSLCFAAGVILLGTAFAFLSYMYAVKTVGPTVANVLACAEPLAATLIAVMWLGVRFEAFDWIGSGGILAAVLTLTWGDWARSTESRPRAARPIDAHAAFNLTEPLSAE
jgi:drug/metabolite transporter (DMT)-like permease